MVMNNKKVDLQELLWRRLWYPIGLRFRKKRFVDFEQFYLNKVLAGGTRRITILDLGGTFSYWKSMNFKYLDSAEITLLSILISKVLPATQQI